MTYAHDELSIAPCGCPEGQRAAATVTRRSLLAGASALGAAAAVGSVVGRGDSTRYAYAGAGYDGDTLVILSLRGGFDGLSAVVPIGDPEYAKARPNIAIPASRTVPLTSMFGLHPALGPLKGLYDRGVLGVVHAVGQASPTRSHFAAMEQMENAAPGSSIRTGWLDRMIGLTPAGAFSAVSIGAPAPPSSLRGPQPELALQSLDKFSLTGVVDNGLPLERWSTALSAMQEGAPQPVLSAATSTLGALVTTDQLRAKGYMPANGAKYPGSDLGRGLKDLANLIKAGVGLRAATIDVGNWDMHTGLGRSDSGWMFTQLTDLGLALAAFATDLGPKLNDVTLVTLSEFGRRVAENGSGGLDHGNGNVSLVLGGGVVGGNVYGRWPGLSADALVAGDLAGTTDYRTVLAEVLEKRAKLPTADVLPNFGTTRLGMFKTRS